MRNRSILIRPVVAAAVALLGVLPGAARAANVSSNWVSHGVDHPAWSSVSHWSSSAVPNNGGGNTYDVTITNDPAFLFSGPQLDVDVTINNLTLVNRGVVDPVQGLPAANLTVLGTTSLAVAPGHNGEYGILHTPENSTWKLGTLTNLSGNVLTGGGYLVEDHSAIVANNADIRTNHALLAFDGVGARFEDQFGNNALRNLSVNGGQLTFVDNNFTTAGNFTNDGSLSIASLNEQTTFRVTGSLSNYDAATYSLNGGSYELQSFLGQPARVVIPNADIRTLNASVKLTGNAAIVDQNGNNAFRHLSSNASNVTLTTQTISPQDENGEPVGFNNNGTVNVPGGQIVTVTTVFTSTGTVILSNPGSAGALIQANGGIITTSQSFLNGNGTVYSDLYFHNQGHLAPGFSPGVMTLDAPTTLGEESSVDLQLGGMTAETEYDVIHVAAGRSLELGGALSLELIDGFDPELYSTFKVIDGAADADISGRFASVANVGNGVKRLAVIYVSPTEEAASEVHVVAAVAGDSDVDGGVSFNDLVVLAQNYNLQSGSVWQTGDFNGDGATDFDDLVSLAQNYNYGSGMDNASFAQDWALAQSLVPEPVSVCAVVAAAAGTVSRRRR